MLFPEDKETVKRYVPSPANKIHTVAIGRLYAAYPNRQRWTYTGLQGAVVLANDLVGNTFWLKMVDISASNRGVIWDQEIYESFSYNQDRLYFHTFETEDCLVGISFIDEKSAKAFKKKVDSREKNAEKATKLNAFGTSYSPGASQAPKQSRFGVIGNLLPGHRHSSAPSQYPRPISPPISPYQPYPAPPVSKRIAETVQPDTTTSFDAIDPSWRGILDELLEMGITEDQIQENQEFIKLYIEQKQAAEASQAVELSANEAISSNGANKLKAPPPPPPPPPPHSSISSATSLPSAPPRPPSPPPPAVISTPSAPPTSSGPPPPHTSTAPPPTPAPPTSHHGFGRLQSILAPITGGSLKSIRGPPPAPPPSRGTRVGSQSAPSPPSPARSPAREPSPPPPRAPPQPRFRAPPPIADAGKFANTDAPSPPSSRQQGLSNPGPPPPPRPPKMPMDEPAAPPAPPLRFAVPPPFQSERVERTVPPPPGRSSLPPPPPAREYSHAIQPSNPPAPPLPPKTPNFSSIPPQAPPLPPPIPSQRNSSPPAPPLPPSLPGARPVPPPPLSSAPPPAPPLPPHLGGGGSAPPPPPARDSGYQSGVPNLPKPAGGKEDVLASIRATGGIGGLKKVDQSKKRDRSAALVPGGESNTKSNSAPGPAAGDGGLAGALASALEHRKTRVSQSDDEDNGDDCPPWYSQIFGFGGNKTKTKLKADDLPPLPGYLDEGPETLLGRSVLGKASNEVKLRCTEFDEHGNVTLVNGEFKKSELIAKYGLLPRDLRKIDSALLPHILVRPSAILINLLHLRVLIKSDHVLVFDTYGSTDSYTQSVFMYDLEGKLRQREGSRQAGGLPYEFRALEAVLISVTTGLEAEFEGVREPVVRVLRALEEDIDRDKLRHLLIYSKKLGTFEQRAKLVRDAIDELLDADDDLAAMYLTEKAKGDGRGEADHTEVEMLLESYHKVCDEIVQVSGNLVSNIRNTEEIVKAILDANRNSLMLLDLKFSIGTLGIGSGAFIAALYGMNLKNFMEESDLGFIGVTGCSFAFALVVCMYGLTKLRKVQRVSMWGEEGVGMVGQGRRNWRSVDDGMPTGRADRLRRLRDSRSDALLDRGSHCAGADAAEGLPPLLSEKVRVGDLPFTRKNKAL
ncbi:MAG: magnesium ion transporter [Trizodia sp. TS-e1964]|nr:MAG: magnesium ion transporter [Trizodia sp. TS-e1964]